MPRGKSTFTMRILADTSQMVASLGATERRLNQFAKVAKIAAGVATAAFVARPLITFAQESVKAASDLEESISKVNVVFGDSASIIQKWAEDSVTAVGLSGAAAQEAAGTFGNLLVSFGEGQGKAAAMSTTLVQLAADLASFNNTNVEDAINALRSGLSGETEPLKRYGIVLQDVRLRQEALAMGLQVTKGVLDPLVKAQASYSLILKDSLTAQGDFERTMDGLANTTRVLDAAMKDAKETIGIGFVQAIQDASGAVGGPEGLADSFDYTAQQIANTIAGFGAFNREAATSTNKTEQYNEKLQKWAGIYENTGDGLLGFAKKVIVAVNAQDEYINFLELQSQVQRNAIAEVERATAAYQAMNRVMNGTVKGADHLTGALNTQATAAREAADAILEYVSAASQRSVRQMDSFGRAVDKNSIYWTNATEDNKRYWESLAGRTRGTSGSSKTAAEEAKYTLGELNNLTKKQFDGINKNLENFTNRWDSEWETWQEDLQKAGQYVQNWQTQLTQNLDIGRAFTNANDKKAAKEDALSVLNTLLANPDADPRAVSEARNNYYKAAAAAAVTWQEGFANQLKDASAFYSVLGDLKNSGLNEALLRQVAALGPGAGTELGKELLGDKGLIGKLNSDWTNVTNAARDLGIGMSDTFQEIGYTQASNMVDALIKQIGKDARKVKRKIQKDFATTVTIKYIADTSGLPAFGNNTAVAQGGFTRSSTSRGRQIVEDIQSYELVSGSSWRV